jgi:hypothetical protein
MVSEDTTMQDRYTDDQLVRLREAAEAIKKLCADGTLYNLLRGKVLLLEGEIEREEKERKAELAAAEAVAKAEALKAEADAKAEAEKVAAAKAEAQKDEKPPT